ncbi:flagellar basal body rod modification protein [Stenotrophomonas ginsengisoli]|uniref:Basal-body rod modification protein FlgD n=1 Tax=Stenotrophomonas ginsengisoli TaxID=336566 RepID=A0A0R0DKS8_9GAMM|nr:flagellar hook capping FlgD N-terminal domain-containing protein [Stenotrophomonas ginsengisoli]KRG78906.1 flagellar basal body rod modification protein [Stenotrophomonas ginsengisoli]
MSTINTNADYYNALGLGAAAGSAVEKSKSDSLGQADFLLLMTTQLQNQDPLKPMDNAQMVSQLAQMSTVQGIETLNTTVNGFSNSLTNDQILKGTALVGHSVLVPSNQWALDSDGTGASGLVAAPQAGSLEVTITDANGDVVRTLNSQTSSAGELAFNWDGNNDQGQVMAAGKYTLSARFTPSNGTASDIQTYIQAPVESVTIGSDGLYLNLKNLGAAPLEQVLRVS